MSFSMLFSPIITPPILYYCKLYTENLDSQDIPEYWRRFFWLNYYYKKVFFNQIFCYHFRSSPPPPHQVLVAPDTDYILIVLQKTKKTDDS